MPTKKLQFLFLRWSSLNLTSSVLTLSYQNSGRLTSSKTIPETNKIRSFHPRNKRIRREKDGHNCRWLPLATFHILLATRSQKKVYTPVLVAERSCGGLRSQYMSTITIKQFVIFFSEANYRPKSDIKNVKSKSKGYSSRLSIEPYDCT